MKEFRIVLQVDEGWLDALNTFLSYAEADEVVRWESVEEVES